MDTPREPYVPGQPGDPALRTFNFRYSSDPLVIAAFNRDTEDPVIKSMFLASPADVTGNAKVVRDAYRLAVENARILHNPVFLSIRGIENNEPISIQEIRLIAVLFCEE